MKDHEAWSTPAARRHAVRTFIQGYSAARLQTEVSIRDREYGFVVRYPDNGREFEHFMIEGAPIDETAMFAQGAWVSRVGAVPMPSSLQTRTKRLSSERFMTAPLDRLAGDVALATILACAQPTEIDRFNADSGFPPFQPGPHAFLFTHRSDGRFAATARYGFASRDDIVIDRVGTLDAFRRRGLAAQLIAAIVAHARRRGARRAWLLSTEAGEPLYRAAGFAGIAPVLVDQVTAPDT